MELDPLRSRLDFAAVGVTLSRKLLVHTLIEKIRRHLPVELVVKPADKPAHLVAGLRPLRHQGRFGAGLLDIFANRRGFCHCEAVELQHRHLAGRVAAQEIRILLPIALLDQLDLDLLLRQNEADLAAKGRKGKVIEFCHMCHPICARP